MSALLDPPLAMDVPSDPPPPPVVVAPTRRKRRRSKSAPSPGWATITTIFVTLAVVAAWGVLYVLVLGSIQEHRDQHVLYAALRERLADPVTRITGPIDPGTPVALLRAPAAGIDPLVVLEGTTADELRSGPGHRRDTVLPGQVGVSVVFGRSTTFGGPFADVGRLRPGDEIEVQIVQGLATYEVEGVRHAGDPLPPRLDDGGGRLTLVTAEHAEGSGAWERQELFVDAILVGEGFEPDPDRLTSIAADEQAMRGESGAVVPLVVWLEVLLGSVVALSWGSRRWDGTKVLVVAVPVLIALAWGATEAASRLLPNLI